MNVYSNIRSALHRRRAYSRTLSELESLSNRELNDLGLARSDIYRVARSTVYGSNV